MGVLDVSELGQPRATQRYEKRQLDDEQILRERIVSLASQYGRYGYRRVTALLRNEGWLVNHKRVERIWRQEGLKVPTKQPKRGRLWLTVGDRSSNGSIVRLRPEFPKHVWSYDFMQDRTHDGRPFRILNVIDEFTRECLAVRVKRGLTHQDVLEVLTNLFCERGVPVHIRSDNLHRQTRQKLAGQVVGQAALHRARQPLGEWLYRIFQWKMRDEFLDGEIFYSLKEVEVLIAMWRRHYPVPGRCNTVRPHSSLRYRPPVPAAFIAQPSRFQAVGLT